MEHSCSGAGGEADRSMLREIVVRGSPGGPLSLATSQLNHVLTH